ncbi:hypothetical protein G7046_g2905 [Stylonectria norvegica]|nr:hypothetical protein G7046_g2905 [Stylonectria norvegica]
MSQVLAVFGATGQQGGSVIAHVLDDLELSQRYKIRAIIRDVNSKKAKLLSQKVQVVQGDLLDRASIEEALTGVHTIFAMTTPFGPDGMEVEYNSGKTIADVAVEKGAEYLIFSTLPSVTEISGGKYTKVTPFENKAKIEQYIRGLPIRSAFCSLGTFMQNFEAPAWMAPRKTSDGTWAISFHVPAKTLLPLVDAVGDTGKFIGAILADPDKYENKTLCAAIALYSLESIVAIISTAANQPVVYRQVSEEEVRENLPFAPEAFLEVFKYPAEFGYYGPGTKNLVAWAAENARGTLVTLEQYFQAHPLRLS